jgi:hypothetical protein
MRRKKIESQVDHNEGVQDAIFMRLFRKKEKIVYSNNLGRRVHKTTEFELTARRFKSEKGKSSKKRHNTLSKYEKLMLFLKILAILVSIWPFFVNSMPK